MKWMFLTLAFLIAFSPCVIDPPSSASVGETTPGSSTAANAEAIDRSDATPADVEALTTAGDLDGPASRPRPATKRQAKHRNRSSSAGLVRVRMRNVDFHVDETIVLRIKNLQGALVRKNKATPPTFDDKKSFIVRIDSGTIGMRTDSLAELMNNYVFAYPHAPLEKIKISVEESKIKLTGTMHKVIDVPVEIVGTLSATAEGKIQLHPTSIKAAGIPVKGLLNLFGLDLSELIKANEARGVRIDDNDIFMDPELIIPPPEIRGKITAIHIEGDEIIQVFGSGTGIRRLSPPRRVANYMYYRGSTLRFGKLTMRDADLLIVDANPKSVFDFSIDHYNQHLIAGYSKNTPRLGLVVFMPDYYRLRDKSRSTVGRATGSTVSRNR